MCAVIDRAYSRTGLKVLPKRSLLSGFDLQACYRQSVMPVMPFGDLQAFVRHLESRGQLQRIRAEVDPVLEAGEISQRVLRAGGPALLFENPRGASMPLLMNLFGAMDRIRMALGRDPAEFGNDLLLSCAEYDRVCLELSW